MKTTPTWYRRLKKHERGKGRWKYIVLEEMHVGLLSFGDGVRAGNEFITLFRDYEEGHRYHVLTVKKGYAWDGASFVARDTPTNMRASLFHDALTQLTNEGKLAWKYRKYADGLLRTHMIEDQILYADGLLDEGYVRKEPKKMTGLKRALYLRWGRFRAWGYYQAVRAWSKFKGM